VTNFIVEPLRVQGDRLTLTGEEARHLHHVLRAKAGDAFYAIDGAGLKYRAVIESSGKASVTALISSVTRLENEPFCQITLAQGLCRPNKMDEIVEKGTETGVSSFIFFFSEKGYCSMPDGSSSARKVARLRRIARAAAKQCKRSLIPTIRELMTFSEVLSLKNEFDLALLATRGPSSKSVEYYFGDSAVFKKILLLVGPESGLSDDEINACLGRGLLPTSLGARRLRAETAAMIFPALVLNRLGEI
jgi:16S rRNA (uracil1498-N3)-methyltransferase